MATDDLKVAFIAGDNRSADAPSRKGYQDIKAQISNLLRVVLLAASNGAQDFSRFDPVESCRREDLAALEEIPNKPPFKSGFGATQEFV
jgi:hypothetical protein